MHITPVVSKKPVVALESLATLRIADVPDMLFKPNDSFPCKFAFELEKCMRGKKFLHKFTPSISLLPMIALAAGIIVLSLPSRCLGGGKSTPAAAASFNIDELIAGKVPPYHVRSGHPRLLITPDNKTVLIDRIRRSDLGRRTFQEVIRSADEAMKTDFAAIADAEGREIYPDFLTAIESCGLIHQVGKLQDFAYLYEPAAYAARGAEALVALAKLEKASLGSNYLRNTALALGYDWLYDLLTPAQRRLVVNRLIAVTRVWPVGTDDPGEQGLAYNCPRGMEMLNPLAFYGDGIDDARAADMVDRLLKQTWWGPQGSLSRLQVLMGGGVTEEEMGYATRYTRFIPALEAWYTATGQDFFQAGSFWKGFARWMIHDLLPFRATGRNQKFFAKMQQMSQASYAEEDSYANIMGAASAWMGRMNEDGYAAVAAWLMRQSLHNYYNSTFFYSVLIGDPLRQPLTPAGAEIPDNYLAPAPLNRTFMRSQWNDGDATFALHSVAEWACLRCEPYTMNSLLLWKNGGYLFSHKSGYRHDYGDMLPDWRYNVIALYQPGDHAERLDNGGWMDGCDLRWQDVTRFSGKGGFLRGAQVLPGQFGYSAGDASVFLSALSRRAVLSSDRQIVWFPAQPGSGSDYFVIYDRVETDSTTVQPHVVFNTIGEPLVSRDFGRPIAGESRATGHWVVKDAAAVTVTNRSVYHDGRPPAHARMFLKVLLPEHPTIHRLGGKGLTSGTTWPQGRQFEGTDLTYAMDVNDRVWENHPGSLNNESMDEDWGEALGGRWRFHITDPLLKRHNQYLVALEATDASQVKPAGGFELLRGEGIIGVQAGNTVALFNPVYRPLENGSVVIANSPGGPLRLLIADLQPGARYRISLAGATLEKAAGNAGVLYFQDVHLQPGDRIIIERVGE